MSGRDQRPPRSSRPRASQPDAYMTADVPEVPYPERPPPQPVYGSPSSQSKGGMISFQNVERGERQEELDRPSRPPRMPSAYQPQLPPDSPGLEAGYPDGRVGRKKSLVRPDREKIEPGHRQWHYRTHAAQLENASAGRVGVMPSSASSSALCRGLCSRLLCSDRKPARNRPSNREPSTGQIITRTRGRRCPRVWPRALHAWWRHASPEEAVSSTSDT